MTPDSGGASSSAGVAQGEGEAIGEEEFGEVAPVRGRRQPPTPTAAEIEEHEKDHYPYRAWCRSCVASTARRDRHKAVEEESTDAIPVIACDYAFLTDGASQEEEDSAPILVTRDKATKMIWGDVVHHKGGDPYACRKLVDHCVFLGHPEIKLRSDGEPPILALLAMATVELKKKGIRVVPDQTPKGDSQAGGVQESAVAILKAKIRCLWHYACELHGIPQKERHMMLPWCVQYAGQLLSRTTVGPDGQTAWRRCTGRAKFPRPLMPWGEKLHYIEGGAKSRPGTEASKWHEGVFVAIIDRTNEYLIATPTGIVKTMSVKRMTRADACDPVMFRAVRGVPWKLGTTVPDDTTQEQAPIIRRIHVSATEVADADLPKPQTVTKPGGPKRVYIRSGEGLELDRYGLTDNCDGCLAVRLGRRARQHNEECRARIMRAMEADGDHRLEVASKRRCVAASDAAPPAEAATDAQMDAPQAAATAAAPAADEDMAEAAAADAAPDREEPEAKRTRKDREKKARKREDEEDDMIAFMAFENAEDERQPADWAKDEQRHLAELGFDSSTRGEILGLCASLGDAVHVTEVFCPPRFTAKCHRFGLTAGIARRISGQAGI